MLRATVACALVIACGAPAHSLNEAHPRPRDGALARDIAERVRAIECTLLTDWEPEPIRALLDERARIVMAREEAPGRHDVILRADTFLATLARRHHVGGPPTGGACEPPLRPANLPDVVWEQMQRVFYALADVEVLRIWREGRALFASLRIVRRPWPEVTLRHAVRLRLAPRGDALVVVEHREWPTHLRELEYSRGLIEALDRTAERATSEGDLDCRVEALDAAMRWHEMLDVLDTASADERARHFTRYVTTADRIGAFARADGLRERLEVSGASDAAASVLGPALGGQGASAPCDHGPLATLEPTRPARPAGCPEQPSPPAAATVVTRPTHGYLSPEQINSVVRTNQATIRYCYEVEVQHQPSLRGRVTVQWRIDLQGSVTNTCVVDSTLESPAVEQCILRQIRRWQFPRPDGGEVVVTYPFIFGVQS